MPKKRYDSHKVNVVGNFFQDITRGIVKCERAPVDEGDFYIRNSNTGLEVKGSDSNHELRLPLHQIEYYTRIGGGFPYDQFFFFLFSYRNPLIRNGGQGKVTSLSHHTGSVEIRNFLATNIETLFIVDIELIHSFFSFCRISNKSIPLHPGVKTLNVRVSYMNKVANGGWQGLVKGGGWNASFFDCETQWNRDLFESYDLKFKIAIIGKNKKVSKLLESFTCSLKKIERD